MRTDYDVAVVGAGPAGSLAARLVAAEGRRVVLVERRRFPRDKVCGSCLHPRAVSVLARNGLDVAREGAVPLRELDLRVGRSALSVPMSGSSLSRLRLDEALARRARDAGVDVLEETRARLEPLEEPGAPHRTLHLDGAVTGALSARLVLDATGLGAGLSRRESEQETAPRALVGCGARVDGAGTLEPGVVAMACGPGGYVGAVRLEDGRLDVAGALAPARLRDEGPGAAAAALFRACGFPFAERLRAAEWSGTPPLTRRAREPFAERVLLLGDAAGYVEPFTGEGIAWALESAVDVAPLAERVLAEGRWSREVEAVWSARRRGRAGRDRRRCARVAALLRHPRLLSAGMRALRHAPWATGRLQSLFAGAVPREVRSAS